MLDDATFRIRLSGLLARTGLSQRKLSEAFGRDPGYVQALLDPSRPSRARPTPDDLVRASEATGLTLVELLEAAWGIEPIRLAQELSILGVGNAAGLGLDRLSTLQRREVVDYVAFLVTRQRTPGPTQAPLRGVREAPTKSRCRSKSH
jgi:transcriptional regulator with XRE-family HTH domain